MVDNSISERINKKLSNIIYFAGCRYWTASLLPALIGTTLPFWLDPPDFSFRWLPASEFLAATILYHSGFSFLLSGFDYKSTFLWEKNKLLITGIICLLFGCLIGLHLNNNLQLNKNVYSNIFLVFGIATTSAGLLYVAPPFSFHKYIGGEVIIWEGLGMIPILGAYLVQTGDLTRTVYLASLPVMASTALWVWISELVSIADDIRIGRKTMVMIFPPLFSGRFVTLVLTLMIYLTLVLAVVVRSSLSPLSLISLVFFIIGIKIINTSWSNYNKSTVMIKVYRYTFLLHFYICLIITLSSLIPFFQR